MKKSIFTLFITFFSLLTAFSQNADPYVSIIASPGTVALNSNSIVTCTAGNAGNNTILVNTLRVVIGVGTNAEIMGLAPGSSSIWTVQSLTTGVGNGITLRNTGGGFTSFDLADIILTVRGAALGGPDLILANIVYVTGNNPALGGAPNSSQGNASTTNDNSQTSLTVTAAVEICNNTIDDDADGFVDCLDGDCSISGNNNANAVTVSPAAVTICAGQSSVLTANITNPAAVPPAVTYAWSPTSSSVATTTANATGTYIVTVTRATGCSATASSAVTVNPLPSTSITASPNPICQSTTLSLSVPSAGAGATYSWAGSGLVAPGNTAAVTAVPPISGVEVYSVTVTSNSGVACSASGSVSVTVNSCNTAPVAVNDRDTTTENIAINVPIVAGGSPGLGTDTDAQVPTQTLTVTAINGTPAVVGSPITVPNGSVTLLNGGIITFTPTTGFIGTTTFPYVICDNAPTSLCDTAMVTIVVLNDNDGDGVPDMVDIDDDNDGVLDVNENPVGYADGGGDLDGDGVPNYQDPQNPSCGGLNAAGACINYDTDGDGTPDQFDLDSDNDGVTDVVESGGSDPDNNGIVGTGPIPADTDQDGSPNTADATPTTGPIGSMGTPNRDTDGDGVPNSEDLDSDNDGVTDILEAGGSDPDNNGIAGTGPIPTDTDGDGIPDVADQSPTFGDTGNTTPNEDTDGDGKPDATDLDSDNDGITDVVESGGTDPDNNGIAGTGAVPTDTDRDGIPDATDQSPTFGDAGNTTPNQDVDGDGTPDSEDLDSDNDGVTDITEAGGSDPDNNGIVGTGSIPTDTDGDGLADVADQSPTFGDAGNTTPNEDTDGDGKPDSEDLDSDNDGITDVVEAGGSDPDNNGIVGTGALPTDTDGDGLADVADQSPLFGDAGNTTPNEDTDGDGTPDSEDLDSDNDGVTDITEAGGSDPDNNGIVGSGVNPTDTDGDGIADVADQSPTFGDAGNTTPNEDTDGDGTPDSEDLDSDNDGITDVLESGGTDPDNNGIVGTGVNPTDTDGDGLADVADQSPTFGDAGNTTPNEDTDGDGTPDSEDLDSDNDGITDVVESGGSDPDNNGIVGSGVNPTDTDGDGIVDAADQSPTFGDAGNTTPYQDIDGDGTPDSEDLDSDNDGITDILEAGGTDPDNNGIVGTGANPTDSDGDGIADIADQSPTFGDTGNTTPNEDTDGDGKPDSDDLDSDNDGVTDVVESGGSDPDNNGLVGTGVNPTDTDGDGLADVADQSPTFGDLGNTTPYNDFDNDGVPNAEDIDSDNDGLTDVVENGISDPDNNGIVGTGTIPTDTDGDGLADVTDQSPTFGDAGNTTTPVNTDAAGNPNYIDIDADNDGIVDVIEWQTTPGYTAPSGTDTDGDGLDNTFDQQSGFGDQGNTNAPTNTDGTDNPDYTDTNSDNDAQLDAVEGWDTDGDNVANTVPANSDLDNDGLDDAYDINDGAVNPTNGTTPTSYPNIDAPATTQRDWREGTPEICNDATNLDEDGDGLVNCADVLSCPPAPTTVSYPDNQECTNGVDLSAVVSPTGGTFSATPAGLSINVNSGLIDVSASTPGTYTVTYTSPTTATNCPGSGTATVTIVTVPGQTGVIIKL